MTPKKNIKGSRPLSLRPRSWVRMRRIILVLTIALGSGVGLNCLRKSRHEAEAIAVSPDHAESQIAGTIEPTPASAKPAATTPASANEGGGASTGALTGEAVTVQLRQSGQYESLAAAFTAARFAAEKIDPLGPHSRGADFFAANPGQQLRAWFGPAGIEIASGIATREGAEPWSVQVRLHAAGRSGALATTAPRTVRAEGSRVELRDQAGAITEWFENKVEGIEQGFTIAKKPQGEGSLELLMAVKGGCIRLPMVSASRMRKVRMW